MLDLIALLATGFLAGIVVGSAVMFRDNRRLRSELSSAAEYMVEASLECADLREERDAARAASRSMAERIHQQSEL